MPSQSRQRVTAKKAQDVADDAPPLVEEGELLLFLREKCAADDQPEQDREIQSLRAKNAADSRLAINVLDAGVVGAFLISLFQLYTHLLSSTLPLALLSTALIPFSASPARFQPAASAIKYHKYMIGLHAAMYFLAGGIAAMALNPENIKDQPKYPVALMWALPAILAAAVEVQRRGDKETAEEIERLEKKKYKLKGA
ncbi:hypothetical protein P7C73_g4010, partial [Tremellales sp. Uapishka_1]